jgi:putative ABC transport system permease protein
MEFSLRSFRYAVRSLRRKPGFALATAAVLGLGIGANTAIFSVVYAVLLRPLSYPDADRIVVLRTRDRDRSHEQTSLTTYLDWKARSRSFESLAAYRGWEPALTVGSESAYVTGMLVTSEFFRVLGVGLREGRFFSAAEDRPGGASRVVILTEGLWRRRFGRETQLVGKTILLDHQAYTVVGILPDRFRPTGTGVLNGPEIWAPLAWDPAQPQACRTCEFLWAAGRLKPGISRKQAAAELNGIQQQLDREYPQAYDVAAGVELTPLAEEFTGKTRTTLLALVGAVGLLLLIACANVANLFLVRMTGRRKEVALRVALGAGRSRIVGHLLAESLTIGVIGGAVGLAIAAWGTQLIAAFGTRQIPRLEQVGINGPVLLFALLLSIATGILFGLAPALDVSRTDLHEGLKEGARAPESGGRKGLRDALVIAELALAVVLLAGAGLLSKSFVRLMSVAPGFDPRHVLTVALDLQGTRYQAGRQVPDFYRQVLERVRAIPGVEVAGAVQILPMGGSFDPYRICVDGQPDCFGPESPVADRFVSTPGYLRAMGIPLLRGRDVSDQDRADSPPVALIGDSLARRLWPGENPLGHRLRTSDSQQWRTIVGVVGDVHLYGLEVAPALQVYVPHTQQPMTFLNLVVRSGGVDMTTLANQVKAQVEAIEKGQPIFRVATMEQVIAVSTAQRRFALWLSGGFALVALALSAVGVYGVVSYSAARRTQEIGIRMAVGAQPRDILRLVLRHAAFLVVAGVAAGTIIALALNRLLSSLLFGVSATDPAVFLGVAALLSLVALVASYVPARRACRLDPLTALRYE